MTIVSVTLGKLAFHSCDNRSEISIPLLCSPVIDPREDGPDRSGGRHHRC